jgi:outer membrane biosynthesis protein TonB
MRNTDPLENELLRSVVNFFGGGAPKAPKPQKLPKPAPIIIPPAPPPPKFEMPKTEMPPLPAPVAPPPPAPPPPTTSSLEAQDAATEQMRQQQRRKGMAASLIAGETGGYASSATGRDSLLG